MGLAHKFYTLHLHSTKRSRLYVKIIAMLKDLMNNLCFFFAAQLESTR